MLINQLAYSLAQKDLGQCEIPGPKNNPLIILAHQCTTYKATDETVPWCSSGMNLWMCLANIIRNPYSAKSMLANNGISQATIEALYKKAGIDLNSTTAIPSNADILVPPTFDASAISWIDWGYSVKANPQEGDVCVFSRKGGHHVAFFKAYSKVLWVNCLGGNQSDSVCYANELKLNLLDIRRSRV